MGYRKSPVADFLTLKHATLPIYLGEASACGVQGLSCVSVFCVLQGSSSSDDDEDTFGPSVAGKEKRVASEK